MGNITIARSGMIALLLLLTVSCGSEDTISVLPTSNLLSSTTTTPTTLGNTWTAQTSPTAMGLEGVTWAPYGANGSRYVAVGKADLAAGTIITSDDGVAWTARVAPTNEDLFDVVWTGTRFVAVGGGGNGSTDTVVHTSPDGVAWTKVLPANIPVSGALLLGVTSCGNLLVAVGSQVAGFGLIISSDDDGDTWLRETSPATDTLQSVGCFNGLLVAVGSNGNIVISSGGVPSTQSWTKIASGTTETLAGVAWSGSAFVATGGSNVPGVAGLSSNAQSWTWNPNAMSLMFPKRVIWSNSRFVTVGSDGANQGLVGVSLDGTSWANAVVSGTDTQLEGIAGRPAMLGNTAQYVAVGGGGTILTSQ